MQELIREDARRALAARMAEWNGGKGRFRRGGERKQYRIAQNDWWIELFADTEGAVPPGDVEIHSELNDAPQPGYRGVKTTLIDREPAVTAARVERDRESTRRQPDRVFGEIRYQDDSGPQTYFITQNEIAIGRGGEELWVDLPLYTSEEVSREHLRLRRDPASGAFAIVDKSRNGTWLNGRRLKRDVEQALPEQRGNRRRGSAEALLRGAQVTGVYQWHTPLVLAFLVFVLVFVLWGSRDRRQGPGK